MVYSDSIKIVDYLDGFQYAGGELNFFPHPEGYVSVKRGGRTAPDGSQGYVFNYVYNYTDHLGNVRVSYSKDPQTHQLKILEENHYYPFGLKHSVYSAGRLKDFEVDSSNPEGEHVFLNNVTKTEYQYKFGAKEWQDELGLNIYDFEARGYDPATVRTTTQDPLAEMYYSASPYSLFNNNPLRYADPTGMKGEDWIKQIGTNGQQTFTYDATVKTVQEAKDKGYENVESVGEYKISGNGYSYDLNSDGSVVYNSPINTSTYVDRKDDFTTPGGRIIKGFCNGCTYSQSYLSSTSNSYFLGDPSRRIAMGMLQGGAAELTGYGMGQALRPISKLVTTSDGFLFGGINTKAPFNISTQRFGNMNAVGGTDYWALKIGSDEVLNRSLNAIKTEWNPLTQYTTGIIPKGTPIKVGIVGPQGGFYGGIYSGGGVQFRVNSNSVINQSTKILP